MEVREVNIITDKYRNEAVLWDPQDTVQKSCWTSDTPSHLQLSQSRYHGLGDKAQGYSPVTFNKVYICKVKKILRVYGRLNPAPCFYFHPLLIDVHCVWGLSQRGWLVIALAVTAPHGRVSGPEVAAHSEDDTLPVKVSTGPRRRWPGIRAHRSYEATQKCSVLFTKSFLTPEIVWMTTFTSLSLMTRLARLIKILASLQTSAYSLNVYRSAFCFSSEGYLRLRVMSCPLLTSENNRGISCSRPASAHSNAINTGEEWTRDGAQQTYLLLSLGGVALDRLPGHQGFQGLLNRADLLGLDVQLQGEEGLQGGWLLRVLLVHHGSNRETRTMSNSCGLFVPAVQIISISWCSTLIHFAVLTENTSVFQVSSLL